MSSATPITMAVVGAGHWGPNLVRNFDSPPASRVHTVVDRDRARLEQVRARFPHVQVTDDFGGVLADPAIQAVVIATPTTSHYALVKAALLAGKHVLVEKPITTRAEEADELTALAEKSGLVLLVGHVFVFNRAVQFVRKYIESGELGRVYYVSMARTNLGPIRVDVNASWDLVSHDVSIVNYWLNGEPETVSAIGGGWINPGIEDAVFATLRYPGNVVVNVHASWLNPRKARDITVVGDKRMLTFDDMNLLEPVRIYDKQVTDQTMRPAFIDSFAEFRTSVRDGDITIPKISAGEPLKAECDHFLDCIRNGRKPLVGGREATAVVRALEGIDRSMRNAGLEQRLRAAQEK